MVSDFTVFSGNRRLAGIAPQNAKTALSHDESPFHIESTLGLSFHIDPSRGGTTGGLGLRPFRGRHKMAPAGRPQANWQRAIRMAAPGAPNADSHQLSGSRWRDPAPWYRERQEVASVCSRSQTAWATQPETKAALRRPLLACALWNARPRAWFTHHGVAPVGRIGTCRAAPLGSQVVTGADAWFSGAMRMTGKRNATMTFDPRIGEALTPLDQFYAATVMIGMAGDPPRFFGSGFFVANVPWGLPYVPDERAIMFLVTAAHVVRPILSEGRQLCVRVARYSTAPVDVPLPSAAAWVYSHEGADVAIVPMPELKHHFASGGISIPAISHEQLFVDDWQLAAFNFRFGDPVRIAGLWYGETTHPQLILRSGALATATVAPVQTPAGQVPVYLVDASVTRGMSGGPAFASNGRGAAENAVIGVNHGYWPVGTSELSDELEPGSREETNEERAQRRILQSVERLNSRLAIVMPIDHVGKLLKSHRMWES